jgi:FAD:protein FMN transferase
MKRRAFMSLALGTASGVVSGALTTASQASAGLHWDSRSFNAMGTTMRIKLAHADAQQAARALDAAVAVVRRIEGQMSLFDPDSAVSRLNRTGVLLRPEPELLEILQIAQRVSQQSQGAFDVTVQPLWQVFDAARNAGRAPSAAQVASARQRVDWRALQVSPDALRLPRGFGITLNGIAQGFAADKVKACLQGMGVAHALVNAGEWAALGRPDHGGDWTLGVANPRDPEHLITAMGMGGRCVATSADDQCSFTPDFVHHHIFDPHTGYSPPGLSSVTVAAPTCVMADALTKVFFMAGYAHALPLAKTWGVEVFVVDKSGHTKASSHLSLQALSAV